MIRRQKFIVCIVCIAFVAIIINYAHQSVYCTYTFFRLPLTSKAPIDELIPVHYALSSYMAATPVARDAKGNLYIAGKKNSKVRILVLNPEGNIISLITPRAKDGQFLRTCLFSVSPSGNRIWTISPAKNGFERVILHDASGKAKQEWVIGGESYSHLLLNAYSEEGAYLATDESFFNFIIGQNYQKFPRSPLMLFPHDGKYWSVVGLKWLVENLPKHQKKLVQRQLINAGISGKDLTGFWGIVSWTHKDGFRLKDILPPDKARSAMIHGIDQDGNFYVIGFRPIKGPLDFLLNLLFKFKPLATGMQYVGISDPKKRRIEVIEIFSSSGGILDMIPITLLIKQPGDKIKVEKVNPLRDDGIMYFWEQTRYGQIVKIDERGIYLEVLFGSGWDASSLRKPREYWIVRIVKKPRWKVWWERLTK
ncbi:MAG: hypothetical protein NZ937_07740 [Armatimonadetes bacterium]|nr:hypothetical protein [Armatimonadota bacterium]